MDLNGDGHNDVLSGSYSRTGSSSMAGLFQVLWGQGDGTFKKATPLTGTDGEPLIIPIEGREQQTENICTRPTAVDWDSDGDLDLVVGNFAGSFYLFTGEGDGKFLPKPEPIMAGNQPLKIEGAHSDPFLVDWDGDGDLDLLSGASQGGVQWAENHAGAGKVPEFHGFETLIEPEPQVQNRQLLSAQDFTAAGRATRVWVDDVNSDGRLDVLVGDTVSIVSPAEGMSEDEFKKRYAQWQEAMERASTVSRSSTADVNERSEAIKNLQKLYRERDQFMSQERTGFVWLYLQK